MICFIRNYVCEKMSGMKTSMAEREEDSLEMVQALGQIDTV